MTAQIIIDRIKIHTTREVDRRYNDKGEVEELIPSPVTRMEIIVEGEGEEIAKLHNLLINNIDDFDGAENVGD